MCSSVYLRSLSILQQLMTSHRLKLAQMSNISAEMRSSVPRNMVLKLITMTHSTRQREEDEVSRFREMQSFATRSVVLLLATMRHSSRRQKKNKINMTPRHNPRRRRMPQIMSI